MIVFLFIEITRGSVITKFSVATSAVRFHLSTRAVPLEGHYSTPLVPSKPFPGYQTSPNWQVLVPDLSIRPIVI